MRTVDGSLGMPGAAQDRKVMRRAWFVLLAFLTLGVAWNLAAPVGYVAAQEDGTLDDSLDAASTPPGSRTPADDSTSGPRNAFARLMDVGIVWLIIFLLISLTVVFFIIEHALTIRKGKLMPEFVLAELEQKIARGEINQAIEFCHLPENHSLAAEVILAGLERYQGSEFGFAEYKTAVEEAGEDQTGRLYRKTEVLGVIGAVAPMLGLTGTVLGMIGAFDTLFRTGGTAKPDALAGDISQALLTTFLGLVVAIPSMIAYTFFRNMIDSIVAEAGKRIERVMMPLGRKR